jgi:hypothetical protein
MAERLNAAVLKCVRSVLAKVYQGPLRTIYEGSLLGEFR